MRKLISFLSIVFFLACSWAFFSVESLPKGFHYEHLELPDPLSIHILEVDPAFVAIRAAHASPSILSLEKTSAIAKKENAIAAVNGGFFRTQGLYGGSSSGALKIGGKWLSSPRCNRGAIGWKAEGKQTLIDRLGLNSELIIKNHRFRISGINQPYTEDCAILYTSEFNPSTLTPTGCHELIIDENLTLISQSVSGNSLIPPGGYVFAIGPSHPHYSEKTKPIAEIKDTLQIHHTAFPHYVPNQLALWQDMDMVVGGTPVLISGGKAISDFSIEQTRHSFLAQRHPRSAVGLKPNGHWVFVVVDGRDEHFSIGMTIPELAEFMLSLGCKEALNLDGGGSSAMYLLGHIKNKPSCHEDQAQKSSRVENPVSDAILLFSKN